MYILLLLLLFLGAEEDAGIPRDAPLAARMSFWTMEVEASQFIYMI